MMRVDIKGLLQKLNPHCTRALHGAAGRCVALGHGEVVPEHFLRELVGEEPGDWGPILAAHNRILSALARDLDRFLEQIPPGPQARPVFATALLELLQDAWLVASVELGEPQVRSGAVLAALLERLGRSPAGGPLEPLWALDRAALLRDFASLTTGSPEALAGAPEGFLEQFCTDFTRSAREGRIDPVFGRDPELRQIIDILARRRKNNPICVGDPGVGKTALVEGLALRIVRGEVPGFLQGVTLLGLDLGRVEAGAGLKGEFERRLKGVIEAIGAAPGRVILFVDEAHTLIGAGGLAGGSDAANLLKPALARGELRTIAATTWSEYKKYFEKDPALARRFQLVRLSAPSVPATVQILRGLRPHYERAHQVVIRDDALAAAAELAGRHLTGRFLPDKAIDLLDTSCARVKVNLTARPAEVEDLAARIGGLAREREALERDRALGAPVDPGRLEVLAADLAVAQAAAADLERRWGREREAVDRIQALRGRPEGAADLHGARARLADLQGGAGLVHHEVDPDVVAQVVSDWTGIPLGRLLRDEAAGLLDLETRLRARIQGQDPGMAVLAAGLQAAKAGLRDPEQPLGVYLLAGPSGTGKTATAQALAELLFGSGQPLVTLNLGEFQEAHSVSRLVGSPPGYVGYGEGGRLTEAVRQRPCSVVLLDEAEKGHRDVLNLFHQVFDRGLLTDGEGQEVSFRDALVVLTSNLGAGILQELGPEEDPVAAIRPALARAFPPSLLARMTVVAFRPLDGCALRRIAAQKLGRIREALAASRGMVLEHTPALEAWLAERCLEQDAGARGLDRVLNGEVLPRLAREVLARLGGPGPGVFLDVTGEGQVLYDFREPVANP